MKDRFMLRAHVDENGNLVLPKELASAYDLTPGSEIYISGDEHHLHIHQAVSRLTKVYIEPTNRCNLDCRTCIRNTWDEPLGQMSWSTFDRILDGLCAFSPTPAVFFGGLGEPLTHPRIVEMVTRAKQLGANVEMITNGTLLTKDVSRQLIDAGLDMLWVSLDGATPESYADVRLGAALPTVLANLAAFQAIRLARNISPNCMCADGYAIYEKPEIGIVFVAMKRNINDLPAIISLGSRFAVSRFMISNVLPYSADMVGEMLYSKAIAREDQSLVTIELPRIDVNEITANALSRASRTEHTLTVGGADLSRGKSRCPFIERGSLAVSWAGDLSPCLPLLHSYTSFVNDRTHFRRSYTVGTVTDTSLKDLWNDPKYVRFREQVEMFDFSPCTTCGGCDLSQNNEDDCFGNKFPTCGNCPWAQGLVQCP